MLSFIDAYFINETIFDGIVNNLKQKVPHFAQRDGLNKKAAAGKLKKRSADGVSKPIISRDCDSISEPLLQREDVKKDFEKRSYGSVEQKGAMRIKVVMTKQEAARLLSKCRDGGRLEFKDVARELVQIPVNRVSVAVGHRTSRDRMLEGIPEEL